MKILHLLTSGGIGGIEILCKDIATYSNFDNVFCFLFGEGGVYEQMKKSGHSVHSLHDNKKISLSKFNKLKCIAKSCDIIVVHHDDPFLEMYYLALIKIYPKKKYISMVHHCYDPVADNLGYGVIKRKLKHHIICQMFKNSNELVFVSKAGLNSYADTYHLDRSKISIVYNGIGKKFLDGGRDIIKEQHSVIKLLFVGRLVELKGVNVLVDVLPEIISYQDVYIDIVGDGKSRNELENKVATLGIQDRVTFHGFKDDVTPYLADADIFVYPSKTEIFGISLVEAMAFKCICVANNIGGIPEIINDEKNGFLNKDNSSEGLKKALIKAIDSTLDIKRRNEIINAARKTAEDFPISKTISNLENIYQRVMEI